MPYREPFQSFTAAMVAALLAGVMQASVILVLSLKMRPVQYLASFLLSSLTGGLLTVLLVKQFHMDVFIAGVFGAFSGSAPAILIPLIVTRLSFKRLGIEGSDLTKIYDMVEDMQDGIRNTDTKNPQVVTPTTPDATTPPSEVEATPAERGGDV